MPPKQRKILVMGYRSVGKSSLCIQYVQEQFVDAYEPTIENSFTKVERIKGQDYVITLVDTAGQDEYSLFSQYHAVDVHGYVLVFSITSRKSFDVVKVIYDKLVDMTGNVNVPIVLVGNKTDLESDRKVSVKEAKELATLWKAAFLEATAKKHESVTEIFKTCIAEVDKLQGGAGGGSAVASAAAAGNAKKPSKDKDNCAIS